MCSARATALTWSSTAVEGRLDRVRQLLQLRDQLGLALVGERPTLLCDPEPDQVHGGYLAGERLGGGNPDLEAGARVEDGVGVAGGLAAHDVRKGEDLGAALLGEAHGGECVGRLARLGDPDDEVVLVHNRIAVAVLGSDVHLDRDARPLLDRVAANEARVVGGPAGDDHDAAHVLDELGIDVELG